MIGKNIGLNSMEDIKYQEITAEDYFANMLRKGKISQQDYDNAIGLIKEFELDLADKGIIDRAEIR